MDSWNPIIGETHIKRVSPLKAGVTMALFILGVVAGSWCAAVLVLSLERLP